MGNQAFWLSLIEDLLSIRSQRGAYGADFWNKQLLKAWKKNLGDFYVDEAYDEHIRTVQLDRITIHTLRDDQLIPADKINDGDVVMPTFSFTYHLPDIIKLVINDQLMEKYAESI